MNVLVWAPDGEYPNLSAMRIVAHYRMLGHHVELRRLGKLDRFDRKTAFAEVEPHFDDPKWDRVYASIIFERTRPLIARLEELYPSIIIGGTGSWSLGKTLTDVGILDGPVDYADYPDFTASIGFAMRGCRFECSFCVVPRKEGAPRHNATIGEIWRGEPWPRHLVLLDNDLFGNPRWQEVLDAIRAGGFRASFIQGFNVRLLGERHAAAIASIDYRAGNMKDRRLYMAWDRKEDERWVFRGLDRLVKYGVKPDHMMVYMLIGDAPGETHEDRDHRRRRLREFGARPYPMPFRRTPELVGFARWVTGAYDKRISWEAWKAAHYSPRRLGDRFSLPLFRG